MQNATQSGHQAYIAPQRVNVAKHRLPVRVTGHPSRPEGAPSRFASGNIHALRAHGVRYQVSAPLPGAIQKYQDRYMRSCCWLSISGIISPTSIALRQRTAYSSPGLSRGGNGVQANYPTLRECGASSADAKDTLVSACLTIRMLYIPEAVRTEQV